MVNKERVKLWVDALRNPDLVQGFGTLARRRRGEDAWRQCCLDVACQVAKANGLPLLEVFRGEGLEDLRGYQGEHQEEYLDIEYHVMPMAVGRWFGFGLDSGGTEDPYLVHPNGLDHQASEWNDKNRYTFTQIADLIEYTFLREEAEGAENLEA